MPCFCKTHVDESKGAKGIPGTMSLIDGTHENSFRKVAEKVEDE